MTGWRDSAGWRTGSASRATGTGGGRTSASGSGERSARTTAPDGDAWDYLPHDHARSRAYRWGEDGLAGFCDVEQRLCLGLALWNGRDPILKERAFGLTGAAGQPRRGRQGVLVVPRRDPQPRLEPVAVPLPARRVPVPGPDRPRTARATSSSQSTSCIDTGAFDDDRYWVVEVHYAKAGPDDLLMTISVTNQGPDADTLHVLPTAWFRNTWSWEMDAPRPSLAATGDAVGRNRPPVPRAARAARRPRAGRRGADGPVLRERDQHPAPVRHRADHPVSQGRHQRPRGHRRGHRQPGAGRHQVRVLVQAHGAAGRDGRAAAAAASGPAARPATATTRRVRRRIRPGDGQAAGRGRRVLRRAHAEDGVSRRGHGHAAGVRRDAVEQAAVLLRRDPLAGRRPGPAAAAARSG